MSRKRPIYFHELLEDIDFVIREVEETTHLYFKHPMDEQHKPREMTDRDRQCLDYAEKNATVTILYGKALTVEFQVATVVVIPISSAAKPIRRSPFGGYSSGNARHERQLTPQPNQTNVYKLRPLYTKAKKEENDYKLDEIPLLDPPYHCYGVKESVAKKTLKGMLLIT